MQLVERRAALYEPTGHGEHAVGLPSAALKVPGKHGMQLALLAEPVTGRYVPSSHDAGIRALEPGGHW